MFKDLCKHFMARSMCALLWAICTLAVGFVILGCFIVWRVQVAVPDAIPKVFSWIDELIAILRVAVGVEESV